jgi:hypothetical protein
VFFKLQLVLFFEGLRSERQLLQHATDRLSVRWYLGYDLDEPLPDHSSFTRIRDRYGIDIFRQFFDCIVAQCQQAGLVWGRELYIDATKVQANAALDSLMPRFAVEAHLGTLFADPAAPSSADLPPALLQLPLALPDPVSAELASTNGSRHDWLAAIGQPQRDVTRGHYDRRSNWEASRTDPDATYLSASGSRPHLGYQVHTVVDGGKARIVLATLATPGEVTENQPALDLLWHSCFRWQLWPGQVTGDATYGAAEILRAVEAAGMHAYMALRDYDKRSDGYGKGQFRYDAAGDVYQCPHGTVLRRVGVSEIQRAIRYLAPAEVCNACPAKARCTSGESGRAITRSFDEEIVDRVRAYGETEAYQRAIRKRSVWVEPLFGEAKQWHGLERFRLRRLPKVNIEALLTTTGQNLKRLLSRSGWGRRPFPSGANGVRLGGNVPPTAVASC